MKMSSPKKVTVGSVVEPPSSNFNFIIRLLAAQIQRHWVKLVCGLVGVFLAHSLTIIEAARVFAGDPPKPLFYLYTKDVSDKPYIIKEPLFLKETKLKGGIIQISGVSKAKVRGDDGEEVEKTFYNSGYRTNDRIVMSYTSDTHGAGTYYFELRGAYWIGQWTGKDQVTLGTLQAPAALSVEDVSDDMVTKRIPELDGAPVLMTTKRTPELGVEPLLLMTKPQT